jgi:hypothetical protein
MSNIKFAIIGCIYSKRIIIGNSFFELTPICNIKKREEFGLKNICKKLINTYMLLIEFYSKSKVN